ncbi:MAG: PASTA domain-containing protein [Clostridia bacterium]|nr:PASTA domain-containing protein [Clostridia bacterium]
MANKRTSQRLRARVLAVALLMVAAFCVVAVNLARIMLVNGEAYKNKAEQSQLQDKELDPTRGIIYDKNGTILAQSASAWKIYVNASSIPDNEKVRDFIADKLSTVLTDVEYETVREKTDESTSNYVVIKSNVEYDEKEAVVSVLDDTVTYTAVKKDDEGNTVSASDKKFKLRLAVGIDDDVIRYYPYGTLASCVIGFTGSDGEGKGGVEAYYDDVLRGKPGRLITAKNGRSDTMNNDYETIYAAENGAGLVLTIDSTIQRYLEEALAEVYRTSQGAGAYGIVMDVNTGAILGMANVPSYDLNNPYGLTEEQKNELELLETDDEKTAAKKSFYYKNWRNFLVSDTYEPGSVFKIVTTSAALESGTLDESYSYSCYGSINVADQIIKCHNHQGHGYQTLREGLMNSCNPFFITVGQHIGKETFFKYFEAFGFTEKTGIDLPGEATPVAGSTYHPLDDMSIVDLSSSAFGQTFQLSAIQITTAISAIANGGYLVTPYVVEKTVDDSGNVLTEKQPVIKRQVISKETSQTVTSMMEDVVTKGTGKNAYVAGYHLAGKTGTSEKLSLGKGHYVASFGCFAPAYDPKIAVLIIVDEPVGYINGGQICTPIAAQVVENTLTYMNVEPQYTPEERAELDVPMQNYAGTDLRSALADLREAGYSVEVVGDGDKVTSQMPPYGVIIPKNGYVVLYTETDAEKAVTEVPDFSGYSIYDVQAVARSVGLNATVNYNSSTNKNELVSYSQSIAPGAQVSKGTVIKVYFKTNSGVADFG